MPNAEKSESDRTGKPPVYKTTAIAQHKHGLAWHEHAWTDGDNHCHNAELGAPAEPSGEVIGEHPTRLYGPLVHESQKVYARPSSRDGRHHRREDYTDV